MKKKNSISLGPGAPSLILIFVVLAMSALGMLALMSARNDRNLSLRSAEVAQIVYQMNEEAEESRRAFDRLLRDCAREADSEEDWLKRVGEALPAGAALDNGLLRWTEEADVRRLECALRLDFADGTPRTDWAEHKLVTELGGDTDLWN